MLQQRPCMQGTVDLFHGFWYAHGEKSMRLLRMQHRKSHPYLCTRKASFESPFPPSILTQRMALCVWCEVSLLEAFVSKSKVVLLTHTIIGGIKTDGQPNSIRGSSKLSHDAAGCSESLANPIEFRDLVKINCARFIRATLHTIWTWAVESVFPACCYANIACLSSLSVTWEPRI